MLGASCTLAHHEAHPEHVQSLSLAKHMLAKARGAHAALAHLPRTGSVAAQIAQFASHDKGFQEVMLMLASAPAMRPILFTAVHGSTPRGSNALIECPGRCEVQESLSTCPDGALRVLQPPERDTCQWRPLVCWGTCHLLGMSAWCNCGSLTMRTCSGTPA